MMDRPTVKHVFSNALCRILLLLCTLFPVSITAAELPRAQFLVNVIFDEQWLDSLEVLFDCPTAQPASLLVVFEGPGKNSSWVEGFADETGSCRIFVKPIQGYSVKYSGGGESGFAADGEGCHYERLADGHSNTCQAELTQDPVLITAYKKWIGGTGEEPGIRIRLECESGEFKGDRFLEAGAPTSWEIRHIDPEGVVCSVFESPGDHYIADEFDCQSLVIFPGKGEECTMVNTKIVKRIEMLNRYGKFIMVLVMLVAGLFGVKRYV